MSRKSDLCFIVHMPHGPHRWRAVVECNEAGRSGFWVVTHVAVAFVACPSCKAAIGHRCHDPADGYHREPHPERRAAYDRQDINPRKLVLDAWGAGVKPR